MLLKYAVTDITDRKTSLLLLIFSCEYNNNITYKILEEIKIEKNKNRTYKLYNIAY